jgi:uncharacterized protein YkwD
MRCRIRMITLLLAALLGLQAAVAVFAGDENLDQREQFILSEINRIRAGQGLPQLRMNDKLRAMARSHSSNMAESGNLSHNDSLGRDFSERLGSKIVSHFHAGENVATNNFQDSDRVAVAGWCQSPKHLKNILNARFT